MAKRKKNVGSSATAWTPFVEGHYPPEHAEMLRASKGFVGVFRNSRYQVEVNEMDTAIGRVAWLAIVHVSREAVHDWRDLQRIKNELLGPEREACELFPAESRLVDTNNQYHLFVLPEGSAFPFGYANRDVSDQGALAEGLNHKQRAFEVRPEGLNSRADGDVVTAVFGRPVIAEARQS